jgi:SpoVK/Ycf46/Vps4 family AAA+-type ATPase
MASVRSLSDLFRAIGSHDLRAATALAARVADGEERAGHRSAAALLRGSLNSRGAVLEPSGARFDIAGALIAEKLGPPLEEVTLTANARRELVNICSEWRFREELEQQGLSRRSKLVFSGPPGCGKTLTARSLGRELGLPVLTVRFSTLVGAYLGQTGANLRSAFAFAEATPCIFLLDEFDAIARTRGRASDVGELDRIVISLLQELDHTTPKGIVVAATNTAESIDRAVWRRFDAHIEFPLPTKTKLERFISSHSERVKRGNRYPKIPRTIKSFADAQKWVTNLRRQEALDVLRLNNGAENRS